MLVTVLHESRTVGQFTHFGSCGGPDWPTSRISAAKPRALAYSSSPETALLFRWLMRSPTPASCAARSSLAVRGGREGHRVPAAPKSLSLEGPSGNCGCKRQMEEQRHIDSVPGLIGSISDTCVSDVEGGKPEFYLTLPCWAAISPQPLTLWQPPLQPAGGLPSCSEPRPPKTNSLRLWRGTWTWRRGRGKRTRLEPETYRWLRRKQRGTATQRFLCIRTCWWHDQAKKKGHGWL